MEEKSFSEGSPRKEVHILTQIKEYKELLERCDLRDYTITEIGVGTGALTELILAQEPKKVVGFEIVPGLCQIEDPRFELRLQDFRTADLDYLKIGKNGLISNPPYSLVPHIATLLNNHPQIDDVILMVRPRDLPLFSGFALELNLSREAFDPPPTSDDHLVIRRGFLKKTV